jgi:hypothetical protein
MELLERLVKGAMGFTAGSALGLILGNQYIEYNEVLKEATLFQQGIIYSASSLFFGVAGMIGCSPNRQSYE